MTPHHPDTGHPLHHAAGELESAAAPISIQLDPHRRVQVIAGCGVAAVAADTVVHVQAINAESPASEVPRSARQALVTVVSAFDPTAINLFTPAQAPRPGATGDPEPAPDFGGVLAVEDNGVVRRRAALAFGTGSITGCARVDDDPLAVQGEFEAEGVGVGVSGQVIGTDPADIGQQRRWASLEPGIAAVREQGEG